MATDAYAEAALLIGRRFRQISAKDRRLARLPEGQTGRQALESFPAGQTWIFNTTARVEEPSEATCRRHYLRNYARGADRVDVSHAVFKAFKELGGPLA